MRRRVGISLVTGSLILAAIFAPPILRRSILSQAESLAGADPYCAFDGHFIQGDVPTARLVPPSDLPTLWADVRDTYLNAEQAKPFHFGIVVLQDDGPAVFGWSYFTLGFWRDPNRATFSPAYPGDAANDCLIQLVRDS